MEQLHPDSWLENGFQKLLDAGREGRFAEIPMLPGSGQGWHLCPQLLLRCKQLSRADRVAFIKAIAVHEDTIPGIGSNTALYRYRLLSLLDGDGKEVFDWVLRNTRSYSYYARHSQYPDGARSLDQYRDVLRLRAEDAAEANRREQERQAQHKARIARVATTRLHNAVHRGDVKAVRALLNKGADATTSAPDGRSLLDLALRLHYQDIATELQVRVLARSPLELQDVDADSAPSARNQSSPGVRSRDGNH